MVDKEDDVSEDKFPEGAFLSALVRNNKQIRKDRATAIAEDAETLYRRTVEDMRLKLRRLQRDRENMLDMSPDTALSLKVASDFKADEYVAKDIQIGVEIRNTAITLEIAERQFKELFGKEA